MGEMRMGSYSDDPDVVAIVELGPHRSRILNADHLEHPFELLDTDGITPFVFTLLCQSETLIRIRNADLVPAFFRLMGEVLSQLMKERANARADD